MDVPTSDHGSNNNGAIGNKSVKLKSIETLEEYFFSSINASGYTCKILTVKRDDESESGIKNQARQASFNLYAKDMEKIRDGNANVRYAWYASTVDELRTVFANGFVDHVGVPNGVSLWPSHMPPLNVHPPDENGFWHVLFCRVILGKTEVVSPCSNQSKPSSDEFDSGVDNLESPEKYIIWNKNMSTHILPEFLMSVRPPSESSESRGVYLVPRLRDTLFGVAIEYICKHLTTDEIAQVITYQLRYNNRKISITELVQNLRRIAGNELFNRVSVAYLARVRELKGDTEQEDSSELVSNFSSQLNIKSRDERSSVEEDIRGSE